MTGISTIGLDLAKSVFQVHCIDDQGEVVLRRALRRSQVLSFFTRLPACLVGMEACGTSHYWARELTRLGHVVKLIPPAYAKAYVRRNKNDAADAAAICEAVGRPSMRFVEMKTAEQQGAAALHKVRALLIKQRTMLRNALRGQMAEYGIVVPEGPQHIGKLLTMLDDPQEESLLPKVLLKGLVALRESLSGIEQQCAIVDQEILAWARTNATARHLITAPGYGPITASAMAAIITNPAAFRSGGDFAASLGLVPRQDGTGGKVRLGPISKRGNGYLRRLLVNGAMSVMNSKSGKQDPWLVKLLASKPRMVVAVALANKMARIGWALMRRQEDFRTTPAAA